MIYNNYNYIIWLKSCPLVFQEIKEISVVDKKKPIRLSIFYFRTLQINTIKSNDRVFFRWTKARAGLNVIKRYIYFDILIIFPKMWVSFDLNQLYLITHNVANLVRWTTMNKSVLNFFLTLLYKKSFEPLYKLRTIIPVFHSKNNSYQTQF